MATREIAGVTVELDENGYMSDYKLWNEAIAEAFATEQGIDKLTDRHYIVIEFMRKEFKENGTGPSIRKLNKQSGVSTKELYELFPGGPAKKAALIAGIPKPQGCV
jgi:TusE/DsrC/DsvC family sulfur relay protein